MNVRVLAALLMLMASLPLHAAQDDDRQLAEAVAVSVRAYSRLTIFDDVSTHVGAGVVLLEGKVTSAQKKEELGRRIAGLPGVRELRNEVDVLPSSTTDDALRRKVARAIYGNPAFWRYAALPQPPIRIIVQQGDVTLTGVVPSEADRVLAASLASGCGERSTTNALRTHAEGR